MNEENPDTQVEIVPAGWDGRRIVVGEVQPHHLAVRVHHHAAGVAAAAVGGRGRSDVGVVAAAGAVVAVGAVAFERQRLAYGDRAIVFSRLQPNDVAGRGCVQNCLKIIIARRRDNQLGPCGRDEDGDHRRVVTPRRGLDAMPGPQMEGDRLLQAAPPDLILQVTGHVGAVLDDAAIHISNIQSAIRSIVQAYRAKTLVNTGKELFPFVGLFSGNRIPVFFNNIPFNKISSRFCHKRIIIILFFK